ncbi:MAG: anti-sigma factor antagonist [Candidatus Sumerlaeota bacterium]|nr:anti-sigma factor antagonist [Candidatus Sumerlaeota bacterium]
MKSYDIKIHEAQETHGIQRVDVIGCLDSHTVVSFEKSLTELLDKSNSDRLLIDLSQLNYISSAGISALMGLTHRLRKRGGDVVLLKPTEKVFRVFRTLGFTNIFTIAEDDAGIQRSFSS